MGKTIEDIKRESGLSGKTFIETHYGMKEKWFFILIAATIIGSIIFAILIT